MIAGGVGAAPFGVNAGADRTRVLFGARTASELGISRPSLYDLMEKLGIERK